MASSIGGFSGGLFNPARAIGPLIAYSDITSSNLAMLSLTPFIGCYLAGLIYKKWFMSEDLEDRLDEL